MSTYKHPGIFAETDRLSNPFDDLRVCTSACSRMEWWNLFDVPTGK